MSTGAAPADRITELETTVADLKEAVSKAVAARPPAPGGQCSSTRPHPRGLVFMRGPNTYMCECGKVYEKNGQGGLREVS